MKLKIVQVFFLFLITVLPFSTQAGAETLKFENSQIEKDYKQIISELQCKVCQNQTLENSKSQLAQDLRMQVLTKLRKGETQDEVVTYMVKRYGDFVEHHPPVKETNKLLKFVPIVLFIILAAAIVLIVRKQKMAKTNLSEQQMLGLLKTSIFVGCILAIIYTLIGFVLDGGGFNAEGLSDMVATGFGVFFILSGTAFIINAILFNLRKNK